ncbi:MAG: hypothetical protein JXR05_03640 [Flavobacteriaceae bacterium]
MKKYLVFFLIFSFLSCKKKSIQKEIRDKQIINEGSITKSDISEKDTIKLALQDKPDSIFIKLTKELQKSNWTYDTVRLKKLTSYGHYLELKNNQITFFNNMPFYRIKKSESQLIQPKVLYPFSKDSVDTSPFKKSISAWGYFYKLNTNDASLNADGVIEQWAFQNDHDALQAKKMLDKYYPLPYFNTSPHYSVINNHLIIFHTRAMAFSYDQKEHFEKLQKIIK